MGCALLLTSCAVSPTAGTLPADSQAAEPDAAAAEAAALASNAWSRASLPVKNTTGNHPWHHQALPGKRPTQYTYEHKDGRDTLAVKSASSASMVRKDVHIPATELDRIRFSWKVPELIKDADLADRDRADSPVRIMLAFEGDRSKFSAKNSMLSEFARVVTGEPMPYATLMYVWCNTRAPGTVINSTRTDRIRKMVVEQGSKNLNQWLEYERNIRADFEKAFGEPPGALVGVAIMTDTDNTRSQARAWYGKVTLAKDQ